jgi:ribosome-binding ATPase YchF (GTP1/OBG family)
MYISFIINYINQQPMKAIEITQQEIRMATRPNVYRNRKKYTRKEKHKNNET